MRAMVEQMVEEQSLPYALSGMLYDDGVIDPRDTRTVLAICLSVIGNTTWSGAEGYGVFRTHDHQTARRQPGRDRPPGLRDLSPPRHRDRRGPLRRRRRPAVRGARPTTPYACRATRRPTPTSGSTSSSRRPGGTGADAVHPGYGFLSENADFARAVIDAGLTWVGPPPEAIESMGDKVRAKEIAEKAGVPVLSAPTEPTEADLPLLVKASAGGGGRGMRVVRTLDRLPAEIEAAGAEAESAFGDGTVFVEPYVEAGRHVEVQVVSERGRHGRARRARLLGPAPPPEGRRGGPGPGPAGGHRGGHVRGRRAAGRAASATAARARSSSSTTRQPTASSSSR